MNILDNITITDAMVGAGTTIAEPAAGETAWSNASVSYAVGDVVIRSTTHRKYRCAVAHTSAASPLPENDATRWVDIGPTSRWAPFDIYTNTAATTTTSLTYVLTPGYFNSVCLYGLTGASYTLTVKDTPGGSTIYSATGFLAEDPLGWYEYLFVTPTIKTKLLFTDIPIRPDAELTLTITAASGQPVGVGMILVGDYVSVFGETNQPAGVVHGATAEPVTYSYIRTDEFGNTTIVRRHSATNLRCRVVFPKDKADAALSRLQSVLDRPLAWIATEATGYTGLNTFGLASSTPVNYDSFNYASVDITVKGMI